MYNLSFNILYTGLCNNNCYMIKYIFSDHSNDKNYVSVILIAKILSF